MLGQTWFKFYCIYHIPLAVLTQWERGLDRHVDDNEHYDSLQQRSFILDIHAVGMVSHCQRCFLSFFVNHVKI